MKATLVSLCQTDAAREAGRHALTPELLAATGARYSRNNEGVESIVARIDPARLDAAVSRAVRARRPVLLEVATDPEETA